MHIYNNLLTNPTINPWSPESLALDGVTQTGGNTLAEHALVIELVDENHASDAVDILHQCALARLGLDDTLLLEGAVDKDVEAVLPPNIYSWEHPSLYALSDLITSRLMQVYSAWLRLYPEGEAPDIMDDYQRFLAEAHPDKAARLAAAEHLLTRADEVVGLEMRNRQLGMTLVKALGSTPGKVIVSAGKAHFMSGKNNLTDILEQSGVLFAILEPITKPIASSEAEEEFFEDIETTDRASSKSAWLHSGQVYPDWQDRDAPENRPKRGSQPAAEIVDSYSLLDQDIV